MLEMVIGAYTESPGFIFESAMLEFTDVRLASPVVLLLAMLKCRLPAVNVLAVEPTDVVKYANVPRPTPTLRMPSARTPKVRARNRVALLRGNENVICVRPSSDDPSSAAVVVYGLSNDNPFRFMNGRRYHFDRLEVLASWE